SSVTYLNGGGVTATTSTRLGFTRVMEGSTTFGNPASTELDLVNPGQGNISLNFILYDATGQQVATATRPLQPLNRLTTSIGALFSAARLPQTGGLVEVTASAPVTGYEMVRFGGSLFMLAGRDLLSVPAGSLYSAQFADGLAGDPFFT